MKNSKIEIEINKLKDWISKNNIEEDDVLVSQLPSPKMIINGKEIVSFCSNNYFGLSKNKKVLKSASIALKKFGIGTCESRRLGGNLDILEKLEKSISNFKNKESAVIFATGLMTNVGVISSLVDYNFYYQRFFNYKAGKGQTLILSDEFNHRSIKMGIKLSRAEVLNYKHKDMKDLEQKLLENKDKNILIITDGIFSMSGDIAPLKEIVCLAKKHKAMIMVDDAHGTGIYGKSGKGIAEHLGVSDEIDISMGTFSKAFGALGGFVACSKKIADIIKYTSSTYFFTSSLPAEQAAGLIESVKIIKNGDKLRKKIWSNVEHATLSLLNNGFDIPLRWSHIIPIVFGRSELSKKAEKFLLKNGFLVSSVTFPAVKKDESLLRITINSTHSKKQIDQLIKLIKEFAITIKYNFKPLDKKDIEKLLGKCPYLK